MGFRSFKEESPAVFWTGGRANEGRGRVSCVRLDGRETDMCEQGGWAWTCWSGKRERERET